MMEPDPIGHPTPERLVGDVVNLQIAVACLHEAAQHLAHVVRARPQTRPPEWQHQLRAALDFYQRARTQYTEAERKLIGVPLDARHRPC